MVIIILALFLLACSQKGIETIENNTKSIAENKSNSTKEIETTPPKSKNIELSDQEIINMFNLTTTIVVENQTKIFEDLSLLSKGLYLKKFDCSLNKTIKADYVITNCHNQMHHNATILTNLIFENLNENIISTNPPISKIIERFNLSNFEIIHDRILSNNAINYLKRNNIKRSSIKNFNLNRENVLIITDPSNPKGIDQELDNQKKYYALTYEKSDYFTSLISDMNSDLEEVWNEVGNHDLNQDTIDAHKFKQIIECQECNHTFYYNKGVRNGNFIYQDG